MYKGQIENMRINVTIVCSIKNKTLLRGMCSLVGPCFNFFYSDDGKIFSCDNFLSLFLYICA